MGRTRMLQLLFVFLLIETGKSLNVSSILQNKIRKLGNHRYNTLISRAPSEPPLPVVISTLNQEHSTTNTQPQPQQEQEHESAHNITINEGKHHRHRHHSVDKSVAGGGVIIGGLAATLLGAIACYIRATRRKKVEPSSPNSSASSPTSSKV